MSVFAFFSIFSAAVSIFLGTFVLYQNPKNKINRLFFLLCLIICYTAFAEFGLRYASSIDDAYAWLKIGVLWPFAFPAMLHFTLYFTENTKSLKSKLVYLAAYIIALATVILNMTIGFITHEPIKAFWGWTYKTPERTLFQIIYGCYIGIIIFLSFYLCLRYYLKTNESSKKNQAKYVTIGFFISFIIGFIAEGLLPSLKVQFPELSSSGFVITSGLIAYAIIKYRLFMLTPLVAAENIISTMVGYLALLNPDGKILNVNQSLISTLKYKSDELIGMPAEALFAEKGEFAKIRNEIIGNDKIINYETKYISKHNNPIDVSINGSVIKTGSGETIGFVITAYDITERKKSEIEKEKLQHQLFQSGKMAAIGTLSGGIAHDFNNILAAITGNAQLIKLDAPRESEQYKLSDIIERSAQRGAELTQKLLALSSHVKMVTSPVILNDIIHELAGLLKRTIEKISTIEAYLAPDLCYTKVDNTQIYQVFLNICINAKEAMIPRGGGKLIIETGNKEFSEEDKINYPDAKPGKYVIVSISDTGIGMDEETIERVFEPFFTSKDKSQGHGLGLAMAFGIVKSHNGFIKVYSEKGKGTCFKIYLPALEEEKIKESRYETTRILLKGHGTILLIDDESAIRELGKSILERFGYKVILAQDGKEGMELYQARKYEINLVMLDLVMPNWDGKRTLIELKKINPAVKVLIASGYSSNETLQELASSGISGFIQKPFAIKELLEKINKILS
jgi:PAS domain S-box-containing protein